MSTSQEKKLPSNRTYTVDDIAAILGIAKSTAYRLVNSGEFKTIRIGYAIRISRKSFLYQGCAIIKSRYFRNRNSIYSVRRAIYNLP